ncbi:MAG: nitronate monooxygenase [Chloroflexi bacterium]|nr:nitronate monooxygenase [Ktedonobacteraceae bacterium]MBV9020712.1 nitronate monooxygenase [Ktedonobacteraceae bacterium]MBV9707784.1 nitronate monooxygenase [Chloroflexota bacterium]
MLHTQICDLLDIKHPIFSAPMSGGISAAELTVAVSQAGGFGLIGAMTTEGPDWLHAQIRQVRERTDKPFGVGFISSFPGLDALVQVALEEHVTAVSHSFADPTPYVPGAHTVGVKVIAQVQTVAQAIRAVQAGVDVLVAQGTEAGGHTGYIGTLPLVAAVMDVARTLPVLAAGGIADGRGLAAMLLLGAQGVWMGTRFYASREAGARAWEKQHLVEAGTDDTVLTKVYDLTFAYPFPSTIGDRVVSNDYTARWHGHDEDVVAHREELREQVLAAMKDGDVHLAAVRAGNAIGLIHRIESAGDIVRQTAAEAESILRERPGQIIR